VIITSFVLHCDIQLEEGKMKRYKTLPLGGVSIATTITGTNITYSTPSVNLVALCRAH
jgi:hypothetical protein